MEEDTGGRLQEVWKTYMAYFRMILVDDIRNSGRCRWRTSGSHEDAC